MRTIKLFFVLSAIWFIVPLRVNAQDKVVFDLALNKQDSVIAYKVVNNTGCRLRVAGSIMFPHDNEIRGSYCFVEYLDKQGNKSNAFLSIDRKSFNLDSGETYIYKVDLSEYMKYTIIRIDGVLFAGYHPLGEFEWRRVFERKTIKF